MDPILQSLLAKLGSAAALFVFMYLRLKRADDQVDKANANLEKLQGLLMDVIKANTEGFTELKTLVTIRDRT